MVVRGGGVDEAIELERAKESLGVEDKKTSQSINHTRGHALSLSLWKTEQNC